MNAPDLGWATRKDEDAIAPSPDWSERDWRLENQGLVSGPFLFLTWGWTPLLVCIVLALLAGHHGTLSACTLPELSRCCAGKFTTVMASVCMGLVLTTCSIASTVC